MFRAKPRPSRRELFCLCVLLANTSSPCAKRANVCHLNTPCFQFYIGYLHLPHTTIGWSSLHESDKRSHACPRLCGSARAVASSSPRPALLPRRLAAMTPDEITRCLSVLAIAASPLSYRSVLKLLSTCSGLARTGVRRNVLAVWRIRRVQARQIASSTERHQQRLCLMQLLWLWLRIARLHATERAARDP